MRFTIEETGETEQPVRVYLSRRNLEVLLSKLDRKGDGEATACTIIKRDNQHSKYPQSVSEIWVTAIDNDEYYDRVPGEMYHSDVK
jgi:hypothetical protein